MSDPINIRIGLQMARELEFAVEDADVAVTSLEKAMADGAGLAWLVDSKGTRHGIAVDKVAFIEVEGDDRGAGVGFGIG